MEITQNHEILREKSQKNRAQLYKLLQVEPEDRSETLVETISTLLIQEFKIFKEMSDQACNLSVLVKDHIRIFRTYEEELLVKEVSLSC